MISLELISILASMFAVTTLTGFALCVIKDNELAKLISVYSSVIGLVLLTVFIVSCSSLHREEMQCDTIIRDNVSYIYLDGNFINITKKYNRNFNEELVLVEYIPKQYCLSGLVYNDISCITKVR